MAEVDFGDSELFQQFDEDLSAPNFDRCVDNGEAVEDIQELRDRLGECEEIISSLKAENQELKRKLKILTRPSGINIQNSKLDGPLLQILFGNNDISKEYRQEIEDYIFELIKKHEQQLKNEKEQTSCQAKPQTSSFVLEEICKVKTSNTMKKIRDAFSVVGSVLYFTSFCLDKLGQPLLNENPQYTEGWEIPKYQQIFSQVISLDGQEMQIKEKRPKSCCFNCESVDHQLKDCPKPKDMNRINEKRKEFSQGNTLSSQRYHAEEVEERFGKYKPGVVSVELLDALGVPENSLPPFIYRMRQLGYPPGWLKEAEMENSGLALYDGKVSSEGEIAEDEHYQSQKISYDVSKLVDFPGFNVLTPATVIDEWKLYGSIPMQSTDMKQNFASYLSKTFPGPRTKCNKRSQESDPTCRRSKKRRSEVEQSSDMDVESGSETPCSSRSSDNFQFQPPLPPGSPSLGTPPPLPRGTPPATPTPPPMPKGTPPATANNSESSPGLQGQSGSGVEDLGEEEDGLTLEELEEQQRLIWAALANADTATNSDSETPAMETPLASSSSSTPMRLDTEMEEREGVIEQRKRVMEEAGMSGVEERFTSKTVIDPGSPALLEESLWVADREEADVCNVAKACDHNGAGEKSKSILYNAEVVQGKILPQTEVPLICSQPEAGDQISPVCGLKAKEVVEKVTSVPHRSKFAAGIIPFEDTPEYRDVAEATGVYLKIRDLLKSSPRNQTKSKK